MRVEACSTNLDILNQPPVLELVVENHAWSPVSLLRFRAVLECGACFDDEEGFCHFGEKRHLCGSTTSGWLPDLSLGTSTIRVPILSEEIVQAADAVLLETEQIPQAAIPLRAHVFLDGILGDGSIVYSQQFVETVHVCRDCWDSCGTLAL